MEVKDAQQVMGVSSSKSALLSKQLKQHFLQAEHAHELPRRIEYLIWAEPLTMAKLNQIMPEVERADLERALATLLKEERIAEQDRGGDVVYTLEIRHARRVWDNVLARLDGLNNALKSVSDAVFGRFFGAEPQHAFARTLTFHLRKADRHKLNQFYEEQLFPFIKSLNDAAEADTGEVEVTSVSVFWAPTGAAESIPEESS